MYLTSIVIRITEECEWNRMLDKATLKCSTNKLCLFDYDNHWFYASLSAVA